MARAQDQFAFLDKVKRIAIIAMFSDDRLLDELVLKGGSALDIAYQASSRASLDLNFSMGEEFEPESALRDRISQCLTKTFGNME